MISSVVFSWTILARELVSFKQVDYEAIKSRFGFYGLRYRGHSHMYMHGLVPSQEFHEREKLMHCAAYIMEEHAPDDPWEALKRLLRAKSERPIPDLLTVAKSPGLVAKGLCMRFFLRMSYRAGSRIWQLM